mmetsp:Transcript_31424/g.103687  ORF Transcript_31424/g.103687 Transcript_31424/m.103687 type:complete len:232 (-) Transcript_31424:1275-1970(-)
MAPRGAGEPAGARHPHRRAPRRGRGAEAARVDLLGGLDPWRPGVRQAPLQRPGDRAAQREPRARLRRVASLRRRRRRGDRRAKPRHAHRRDDGGGGGGAALRSPPLVPPLPRQGCAAAAARCRRVLARRIGGSARFARRRAGPVPAHRREGDHRRGRTRLLLLRRRRRGMAKGVRGGAVRQLCHARSAGDAVQDPRRRREQQHGELDGGGRVPGAVLQDVRPGHVWRELQG